ncbi:hypothetical protein RN001_006336 [Aquatica leii]|uniref:Uncharacterized protein n=1 Tax=Aquatica leii TaxID=1421715 RepID=A0AAN7PDD7_9COLE|nr:hypothetical protein RN001_006336 [Aquatica leii]
MSSSSESDNSEPQKNRQKNPDCYKRNVIKSAKQDIYLQQLIKKAAVKKHRPRKEDSVPREYAFKYFIDIPSKKQVVCKKAFISIYGISQGRVRRLSNLHSQSFTPHDKRGKHPKANTTPLSVLKKTTTIFCIFQGSKPTILDEIFNTLMHYWILRQYFPYSTRNIQT